MNAFQWILAALGGRKDVDYGELPNEDRDPVNVPAPFEDRFTITTFADAFGAKPGAHRKGSLFTMELVGRRSGDWRALSGGKLFSAGRYWDNGGSPLESKAAEAFVVALPAGSSTIRFADGYGNLHYIKVYLAEAGELPFRTLYQGNGKVGIQAL